jgi:GNAT superfamily N-acetyltransferase
MSLSSRTATPADIDFARETHHVAYRDVVVRQFGSWDENIQDRLFEKSWCENPLEILLYAGVPCGYAGVDNERDGIRVRELVLRPEYQGQGLGTQFLRCRLRSAALRDAPVRLQVLKANRAVRLYGRLGFKVTSTTDTHVLMEWHKSADCAD